MRVKPVKHYRTPRFPTRDFVEAHPEILKLIPKRWRNNRAVLVILATVLLISMRSRPGQAQSTTGTRVAPIFTHGPGHGSFGGYANTAVPLSEEQAQEIIDREAAKNNLSFSPGLKLENVILPPVAQSYLSWQELEKTPAGRPGTLEFDGYDSQMNVAFEYVSLKDCDAWRIKSSPLRVSGLQEYSTSAVAFALRDNLIQAKPQLNVGIFYDPLTMDLQASREELLRQVRDFLAWLKAEGVI